MKRKLNILIVTQYFWPENFRINDLALGLQERGHMIEVMTGLPNYPSGRLFNGYSFFNHRRDNFNGIPVYRVPLVPRGNGGSIRLALNYFSFAILAGLSAPYRCRKKYDVIFVYEPSPITVLIPALIIKITKFTPLMFWMQDLWPESLSATGAVRSTLILKLVELMVRLLYKGCDRILAQSRAFIAPVVRLGGEPNRIAYYPNSAEGLYRPIDVAKNAPERKLLPNGFRVIFAGNIGAAQDFETILGAAEQLKNRREIRFVILGDGRMLPWVRDQIQRRGLQKSVHLLGRYPVDVMPRFFALSDALLVTLKKEPIFALTIPSKIQSYLACAKPIVAALDGEGSRIVEEAEAGVTCSSQNPIELANAVIKLYEMSEKERQEMGQRGRAYFERNFEREMLLDRLVGWMKEVAVQRRGTHANFDSRR
jgi:glycosyltransferase involved in cell wall biosynthesis